MLTTSILLMNIVVLLLNIVSYRVNEFRGIKGNEDGKDLRGSKLENYYILVFVAMVGYWYDY